MKKFFALTVAALITITGLLTVNADVIPYTPNTSKITIGNNSSHQASDHIVLTDEVLITFEDDKSTKDYEETLRELKVDTYEEYKALKKELHEEYKAKFRQLKKANKEQKKLLKEQFKKEKELLKVEHSIKDQGDLEEDDLDEIEDSVKKKKKNKEKKEAKNKENKRKASDY